MSVHNPFVLARWRTIIAEQGRSPLTIAAFCRVRKLCKSNFHRWRNILEQLDRPATASKPAPAFVPVRVIPEAEAVVEVILPSGIQLRVPPGADASQVARLAHALGANRC
jgi:hypothetical protein